MGGFWLGKISGENKQSESKNSLPSQEPNKPNDNLGNKSEAKFSFIGITGDFAVFDNFSLFFELPDEKMKTFYINTNYPRIKQLLGKEKLQAKKQFIIRYEKRIDGERNVRHFFDKNSQELEISEI